LAGGADPVGWGADLAANISIRRYGFLGIQLAFAVWQNKKQKKKLSIP
jgi:hypothetical protein